ncbi:unnamed protein product [Lymnaea stagnalis]|uniref:DUF4291 domain-containing protein n=1 Tax=Lymnaea stagnalis TaxID=6523 RepID=A0AAV2IBJ7_LYMST
MASPTLPQEKDGTQSPQEKDVLASIIGLTQLTLDKADADNWELKTEYYVKQQKMWPTSGRHILAHYDAESVIVYQAFKASIATFAVTNQRFGGSSYSFERMSWIKTSFMWMMYRCGWGQKTNQERVLAIRVSRKGFDDILSKAYTIKKQKEEGLETKDIEVRLQWDPDHDSQGEKLTRKAIQLGLKGKTLLNFSGQYILNIKDITDFVNEQCSTLQKHGLSNLVTPLEQIYIPSDEKIVQHIDLEFYEQPTITG